MAHTLIALCLQLTIALPTGQWWAGAPAAPAAAWPTAQPYYPPGSDPTNE